MADTGARILIVCTANVCRSPAAELRLNRALAAHGLASLAHAGSAGTDALPGEPRCPEGAAHAGPDVPPHAARPLTADDLRAADLVLALDRTHRAACARLLPAVRPRLFTLRQAAALAVALRDDLAAGTPPAGSPPLPPAGPARLRWAVAELDAARGRLAGWPDADLDLADAHGPDPHPQVFAQVDDAVDALVTAFADVERASTW